MRKVREDIAVAKAEKSQKSYEAWVKSKNEAISMALQFHREKAENLEANKKEKSEKEKVKKEFVELEKNSHFL